MMVLQFEAAVLDELGALLDQLTPPLTTSPVVTWGCREVLVG
jgi:hypothetical protein